MTTPIVIPHEDIKDRVPQPEAPKKLHWRQLKKLKEQAAAGDPFAAQTIEKVDEMKDTVARAKAAAETRWRGYQENLEADEAMWDNLPLEKAFRLLADLRLATERGAKKLRDREAEESGPTVPCMMKETGVLGCKGDIKRGTEVFKRDRIVDGRVLSTYLCSVKCHMLWQQGIQAKQKDGDQTRGESQSVE